MAGPVFAVLEPTADSWNTVYTITAGNYGILSVNIANTSASAISFRLAATTIATPNNSEMIEYNLSLAGYSAYERTGLVLTAGYIIKIYPVTSAGLVIQVYGFEETNPV